MGGRIVEQMDLWTDGICEGDDGGRSGREEPFCRCPKINKWFQQKHMYSSGPRLRFRHMFDDYHDKDKYDNVLLSQ